MNMIHIKSFVIEHAIVIDFIMILEKDFPPHCYHKLFPAF